MKKIIIYLLLINTASIMGMEKPEEYKTPEKKTQGSRRRLFEDLPKTSPSKPGFISPEPASKKRGSKAQKHTGYTETERESEYERKYPNVQIPLVTQIHNNFNYPILVVYPLIDASHPHYEPLKPGEFSKRRNVRLAGTIVISANNKIHEIEYIIQPDKQFILDTINDDVEMEPKTTSTKVEIEIDQLGNLVIKPVS